MNKLLFIILLSISWIGLSGASQADDFTQKTTHSRATLVSEKTALVAGEKLRLGLLLEHEPGWHSYWENPGDAGLATEMHWDLPAALSAGPIDWPTPQRMAEGPLTVFSYSGKLLLPVTLDVPQRLEQQAYTIRLKATWLVCNDICIPEEAQLTLDIPVAGAADFSPARELFAAHDKNQPQPVDAKGEYHTTDKSLVLTLPMGGVASSVDKMYFFIRQPGLMLYPPDQEIVAENGGFKLFIPRTQENPSDNISGILQATDANGTVTHLQMQFAPAAIGSSDTMPVAAPQGVPALGAILLAALIGGLILNLMPCVLPVLSLKALAIAKKTGKERSETMLHGAAYTLGILLSFGVIAGILIGLKNAGDAVGWGYQMQSPAFVGFLIYLLFLVGLNLSGMYHLPVLLGNVGGKIANESSPRGSFFTGILATLVATPCTAPFMASAVGAALTLPAPQAMLVFLALGFGLALPFLLISVFPGCLRFLPKPGAWMETFKQFLAFPMYASVIWLLWVLTQQTGANGLLVALAALLAIIITIWMRHLFAHGHNYRPVAIVFFLVIFGWSLTQLSHMEQTTVPRHENAAEFSPVALEDLRRQNKAVFVDATAAWCITCQVNKRVIESEAVQRLFAEKNITFMVADWTLKDAEISAWLASFGYQGVPLYVYYPPGFAPVVLPQILTQSNILEALE